ncbi:MAG: FkbM family methyltransferase [Litoreibacter sp.]|nr:FkbM family methyltransferase [Litoreibacter sp.]MCY4335968.1 FkbM family methyltransferase [Litoreibacter sp.]
MAQFELNGIKLRVPAPLMTKRIRERLDTGRYEAAEARAVKTLVQPGDRMLDLGSGVGYVAALAGQRAGPQNVVTVEANPALAEVIRTNLDANGCGETLALQGAVMGQGAPGERVTLSIGHAFWAASVKGVAGPNPTCVKVPVLPLPQLLSEHRPSIVMMDIEGAEADLFDAPWPDHIRAVTLELHPKRYPETVIQRIFDTLSRSGLIYAPDLSRGAIVGFRRAG